MPLTRSTLLAALLLVTSCAPLGAGDPESPAPANPEAPSPDTEAEPEDPEPTLEDRWRAPFAVISRGRTAPRPERAVIAVDTGADSIGLAEAPGDGDELPAAATPADSAGEVPEDTLDVGPDRDEPDRVAGGVDGVEEDADEEAVEDEPASGQIRHRVEWGETWYGIARRYGVSIAALAAANPMVDPETLRAGEVILIPAGETAPAGRRTHTVVAGDSLWGISRRYGVSIERLREANRLTGDRVRIGQVLIIP